MSDTQVPECWKPDAEHEWFAPHEIVGGCEDAPGVSPCYTGSVEGGLCVDRVCVLCGCRRLTFYEWCADGPTSTPPEVHYIDGGYHNELMVYAEKDGRQVAQAFLFDDSVQGRYFAVALASALEEYNAGR